MSAAVAIAATEAREAVKRLPEGSPIDDRFRVAMKVTYRHWMATNEEDQFLAACEAVYSTATEEEQERIKAEVQSLRDLSAMMEGVPVNFEELAERVPVDPIGLRKLWHEVAV